MSTSSFADSFDALSGNSPPPVAASEPVDPFDEVDGISGGHDSQRVDTFSNFTDNSQAQPTGNGNGSFFHGDDGLLESEEATDMPIRGGSGGFVNGLASDGVFAASDGPVLPPPSDMQEEGAALREWKKQNAILLEEKEKREKELLSQIIEEANEYKVSVYEKRKVTCEKNKISNREKEKLFVAGQEKFHKESSKQYWKAIAELIPNEVPAMQKRRGKKDQEMKPSIVVVQGPKPGKPADLSRLRQILVKLKHSAPDHLRLSPAPAESAAEDAEASNGSTAPANTAPVAVNPEAVVAA